MEAAKVKGRDLTANPKNWRRHPDGQIKALDAVLGEVGIADALIARRDEEGSLVLIDGHLRAAQYPDTEWTVLVLDVDQREADLLLASIDPLAALANTDTGMLDALLRDIDSGNAEIQQMLADLAARSGLYDGGDVPDKQDRAGSSPWDRVQNLDGVCCLIGDVEFSITSDLYELWRAVVLVDDSEPPREAAKRWMRDACSDS